MKTDMDDIPPRTLLTLEHMGGGIDNNIERQVGLMLAGTLAQCWLPLLP